MPIKRASQKAKSDHVFGQRRRLPKMLRAGLYARVSTIDQQTLAMQNRAMREYAARRGWAIAMQVREVNSGAAKREAREKLLEAARRREIDLVLVWRLDRWGRSVTDLLATLQELEHLGVGFRLADRGAGSDHAGGTGNGGIAGRFRGVRARDSAGENQGWLGARPTERATVGSADDGRTASYRNPEATPRRLGKSRNRPSTANRSDLRPPHFGPTYFWLK